MSNALSRREFLSGTAFGVLGLAAVRIRGAEQADVLMYVGTYTSDGRSKGIQLLGMSRDTGALRLVGLAAATDSPSFVTLSADEGYVYAVNEVSERNGQPTGGVSAFVRDRSTNSLHDFGSQPTGGTGPCYVSTDRSGRVLFVANYGGGSVSMFPRLPNGGIGPATAFVQHRGSGPETARQAGPHAHCIITDPSNHFVLVADLGLDKVLVYAFDERARTLDTTPVNEGKLAPGAGPRHLAFHPTGRTLYVTNELNSTITAFAFDAVSGSLVERQTLPSLSEPGKDRNYPADIHLHPSGRYLYMSNRGHDSIAVFAIDAATTLLRPVQRISTGAQWPRNFAIDGRGEFLVVANQRSDSIHSFRINAGDGTLTATGHQVSVPSPVCVRFLA